MDEKTLEIINAVRQNADLLLIIFRMLDLKEQIKTTTVCVQFKYVIENFIWKLKFRDMKIQENCNNNKIRLIINGKNNYVTECEGAKLLDIVAKYVEKLEISYFDDKSFLTNYYNLNKLSTLKLENTHFTQNNIQHLTKNCPNLETIHFINCKIISNKFIPTLQILAKLKMLKSLQICTYAVFTCNYFTDLLNTLDLTAITLECKNFHNRNQLVYLRECPHLKEFKVGTIQDTKCWLDFKIVYLKICPNLTSLSLCGNEVIIDNTDMAFLAEHCKKLEYLVLKNFQIKVNEFPNQWILKKLSLEGCTSLTWENLKNIFSVYNLEEFVTLNTVYEGMQDLTYINVNNSLKILEITTRQSRDFSRFLQSINNTLYNLKIFRLHFDEFFTNIVLTHIAHICPNLQEFYLRNVIISIDQLMQLANLKILRFNIFIPICWRYISTLLKHPSISHLSVGMTAAMDDFIYNNTIELPILTQESNNISCLLTEFNTNFKFIKIPFIIFYKYQSVFLDLLSISNNLKLKIFGFSCRIIMVSQIFLKQLLNHSRFPTHIKRIQICYNYFDCQVLRENFPSCISEHVNSYECTICFG